MSAVVSSRWLSGRNKSCLSPSPSLWSHRAKSSANKQKTKLKLCAVRCHRFHLIWGSCLVVMITLQTGFSEHAVERFSMLCIFMALTVQPPGAGITAEISVTIVIVMGRWLSSHCAAQSKSFSIYSTSRTSSGWSVTARMLERRLYCCLIYLFHEDDRNLKENVPSIT